MSIKWNRGELPGLRYYEDDSRKNGIRKDRYYALHFKVGNTVYDYGLGWQSDGVPEEELKADPELTFSEYCRKMLRKYKTNKKSGTGAQSPKDQRRIADEKRKAVEAAKKVVEAARVEEEKKNVTFDKFITEEYFPQRKKDKKLKTYKSELSLYETHLSGVIGHLHFDEISGDHIEAVKNAMKRNGLSNRTIQYMLQLTRQVFNRSRDKGVHNLPSPTKYVSWPAIDNMKMKYLSVDQIETLLEALAKKSRNLHDMSLLSLHCGLRFSEIANLRWSHVDFDKGTAMKPHAGTLLILNGKTGSRQALLTETARAMLLNRERGNPDELIFKKRGDEEPMKQVSKVFIETVNELGFNRGIVDPKQKITFHSLRHCYGTYLYLATGDIYLTQQSLGHKTATMTARYAKVSSERYFEGAKAVEEILASGKAKETKVINFSK